MRIIDLLMTLGIIFVILLLVATERLDNEMSLTSVPDNIISENNVPDNHIHNNYTISLDLSIANGYDISVDVDVNLDRSNKNLVKDDDCGESVEDPGDPIEPIPAPVPDLACPPPRRLICR